MIWLQWLVGTLAGLVSGCGVGGGTLLLLYLTAVEELPQRLAAAINLLYFICCTPVALFAHIRRKLVSWSAFWPAALAGMVTAALAAAAVQHLPADWLRRAFGVLLLYIGAKSLFTKEKKSKALFRK